MLASLGVLASLAPARAIDCRWQHFDFPAGTFDGTRLEFEHAVLRVEAGDQVGSGYLIDAAHGLVLTAAHVVLREDGTGAGPILAQSPSHPASMRLELKGELSRQGVDLALLQFEDQDVLANVLALDVMTDVPFDAGEYLVLGYPHAPSFPEAAIDARPARIVSWGKEHTVDRFPYRGLLVSDSAALAGVSGGPLVDFRGTAIGTAIADVGAKATYFSSLTELARLLATVELSDEMDELDENLRDGTADAQELARRLKANRFKDAFRNVDLVRWASDVAGHTERYRKSSAHFDCPIQEAFAARGIRGVTLGFGELIRPVALEGARIERAFAAALLERNEEAMAGFSLANSNLGVASGATAEEDRWAYLTAYQTAQLALGTSVSAAFDYWAERTPAVAEGAPPPPAPLEEKLVLRGVNFAFGSAEPDAGARAILDEAATLLRENPGVRVSIGGHTDSVGPDAYNQALSERRAKAVKRYLVAAGVAADRLATFGYGESNPIASNDTADGIALNRRVELNLD